MTYIKENFLLTTKTAEKLYNNYAKDMPIFDYHCHLPEKEILENKPFEDIFQVWLGDDHYKWRLMRNIGVNEEYITGSASNKDKFKAYCKAVSTAFGNPLYHWSQVELKEYFNCELEVNEQNADLIWDWCNEYIRLNNVTPKSIIEKSNVKHLFTTNEAFDDLTTFEKIKEKNYAFDVIPAFRADKIMGIESEKYNEFVDKVQALTIKIETLSDLEKAIEMRLKEFIAHGTRAADIAVEKVYDVANKEDAQTVFEKRRKGESVSEKESEIFKGYLTYFLFALYSRYNLATELHLGATRNNNTVMFKKLGADAGFDSVSEENSTKKLCLLFDKLNTEGSLGRTIVFNLNPKLNAELVPLIGSFQSDEAKGKMQYGPAWWFLDNKQGMEKHISDLTATGHIAGFVGMLTDSRSFLSYPRHHYFRRILCSYLGSLIEKGEITSDIEFVGAVVRNICYNNCHDYFKM